LSRPFTNHIQKHVHIRPSRYLRFNAARPRKRDTGNESCTGRRRIIYLRIKTRFHAVICLFAEPFLFVPDRRESASKRESSARREPREPAFYPVIPVATGDGSGKEFRFFLPSFLPSFVADKLYGILGALSYPAPVRRCGMPRTCESRRGNHPPARRPSRRYDE